MSRLATIAGTATGDNKAKKFKSVVKAFEATTEAAEDEFPGVEVEMAHYHSRVDIEHGPIHFAIRDEQLQLTPYEGQR